MKNLMKILCLLICAVMCLGAVACAANPTADPGAGDAPSEGESQSAAPESDKKNDGKGYSTYELTLIDGCTGTILVNDFDDEGRLIRTNIKGDPDDFGGLVTMYMDHTYSDAGVLLSSTLYGEDLYGVFGPAFIYEKIGTINWSADGSGRIVSGMAQNAIDFWGQISITYHGESQIPDTVVMSEIGDPDCSYVVKYDESGKKISEQYEDDIIYKYTYESPTLTKVEIASPKKETAYAGDHVVEYDESGRIIKTVVAEEEEEDFTFSYTYVGDSNAVATCCLEMQEEDGWSEELELAFEYDESGLLASCVASFKELYNGEVDGLWQDVYTVQRDELGRVIQYLERSACDGVDELKEITTVEYKDALSFIATRTHYSRNEESGELEVSNSSVDSYKYDENGNCIEVIYESFDKNQERTNRSEYRYEYDSRGNRTRREEITYREGERSKTVFDYVYGEVPVLLKVTYCSYDAQDERETKSVIEYEYNSNFARIQEISTYYGKNDVITSHYINEYNEKGQRISHFNTVYSNGAVSGSYVILYEYNNEGKKSREQETRYNAIGDVTEKLVREYEYDQYGVDKKVTVSRYDASLALKGVEVKEKVMLDRDRMHTMTDSTYDGQGNLLEKKVKEYIYEGEELIKIIEILYDGAGNELGRNETEW